MPLAGQMKLRTFLGLVGGGVALLLAAGGGAFYVWGVPALQARAEAMEALRAEAEAEAVEREAAREQLESEMAERQRVKAEQDKAASASLADEAKARGIPFGTPVDQVMARYLGKPLGTKKKKDVTTGRDFKVNVYQDEGHSAANRAKVDLDRDDQWDEKWTWADGLVSRKIAPNDDEDYSVEEVWSGEAWTRR